MSLEQLSFLAQVISAIVVFASLIFVGFQLRAATAAIRSSSSQGHSQMYTTVLFNIANGSDFARIWAEGLANPSSLKGDEWVRFVAFVTALLHIYESTRAEWLEGNLDCEHWHSIEAAAIDLVAQPGFRAAWDLRRHWVSPSFDEWLESLKNRVPPHSIYNDNSHK